MGYQELRDTIAPYVEGVISNGVYEVVQSRRRTQTRPE
jgi:hypothetical protein